MSLPQIKEADPWLEEDEEKAESHKELRLRSQKKLREIKCPFPTPNFTSTIIMFAKITIYSYLLLKLLSKSPISRIILASLKRLVIKHQCISSIMVVLLITFLGKLKINSSN